MRATFTVIHRWAGLFIAVFLAIAGLTGAVISWDHELDEWLNPHLYDAKAEGAPLPPLELVKKAEDADPRGKVTFFPLQFEQGHNASLFVEPRVDPKTGELYSLDYNQVFIDPASGEIAGKRYWGAVSLDTENILPFLYKLHYSMHIPDFWGIDRWGMWFMGLVGIVWMFDCFVGFYLTLPARLRRGAPGARGREEAMLGMTSDAPAGATPKSWWDRWAPAWKIKRGASSYRLNLDLHRAFGLWLWIMLLILAFTSISMNLNNEVVRPILSQLSSLTPDAFDDQVSGPAEQAHRAQAELHRRHLRCARRGREARLGRASGQRLLRSPAWALLDKLLPSGRRPRLSRHGRQDVVRRCHERLAAGRASALGGHRCRHLHAASVPASFRAHRRHSRPRIPVVHGARRCPAVHYGHCHLVQEAGEQTARCPARS